MFLRPPPTYREPDRHHLTLVHYAFGFDWRLSHIFKLRSVLIFTFLSLPREPEDPAAPFTRNIWKMRASTLAIACAFAVIIAGAEAQDFSGVCLDPTDYDGSNQFTYEDEDDGTTVPSTCDAAIAYHLAPDKTLKDEDFSQAWSCEGKSWEVRGILDYFSSRGCCGTSGKSACWKDHSNICLDPNNYDGSKEYTYEDEDDGSTHTSTCDAVMSSLTTSSESPLAGEDFSQGWCEGKSSEVADIVQGITSLGCCGVNGKSACWKDHSHICHDPADYDGSKQWT